MSKLLNRMKRIWAILLCLAVTLSYIPFAEGGAMNAYADDDQDCGENLPFTIEDTGYGVKGDGVTAKKITVTDPNASFIGDAGDNYYYGTGCVMIKKTTNTDKVIYYLISKNGFVKSFDGTNSNAASFSLLNEYFYEYCLEDYPDELYVINNPETSRKDIYNATADKYYTLNADDININNSSRNYYEEAGLVTYTVDGRDGLLKSNGEPLTDAVYDSFEMYVNCVVGEIGEDKHIWRADMIEPVTCTYYLYNTDIGVYAVSHDDEWAYLNYETCGPVTDFIYYGADQCTDIYRYNNQYYFYNGEKEHVISKDGVVDLEARYPDAYFSDPDPWFHTIKAMRNLSSDDDSFVVEWSWLSPDATEVYEKEVFDLSGDDPPYYEDYENEATYFRDLKILYRSGTGKYEVSRNGGRIMNSLDFDKLEVKGKYMVGFVKTGVVYDDDDNEYDEGLYYFYNYIDHKLVAEDVTHVGYGAGFSSNASGEINNGSLAILIGQDPDKYGILDLETGTPRFSGYVFDVQDFDPIRDRIGISRLYRFENTGWVAQITYIDNCYGGDEETVFDKIVTSDFNVIDEGYVVQDVRTGDTLRIVAKKGYVNAWGDFDPDYDDYRIHILDYSGKKLLDRKDIVYLNTTGGGPDNLIYNDAYVFQGSSGYGLVAANNKVLLPDEYSFVGNCRRGASYFEYSDNEAGVIDASGNVLIKGEFTQLERSTWQQPTLLRERANLYPTIALKCPDFDYEDEQAVYLYSYSVGDIDPGDPDEPDEPVTEADVTFNYRPSFTDEKGTTSIHYADSFFSGNSKYNHELAKASLGMAMAGMGKSYISDFLQKCGFSKESIMQSNRYDYNPKSDEDKVAFTFATKEINGKTVIAVSLRGGEYGYEWGSNGRVGYNGTALGYHYGFNTAANYVIKNLKAYNSDLRNATIWITGYSRSAAVANCVAEKLEKDGLVKKSNLYCYGFATPRTVTEGMVDRNVQGIYNIVNPIDLVPCVPLNSATPIAGMTTVLSFGSEKPWDYTRHGTTLELPSHLSTVNYRSQLIKMREEFSELTDHKRSYTRINGNILQSILNVLAACTKTEQNYVSYLQDKVAVPGLEAFSEVRSSDGGSMPDDADALELVALLPAARAMLRQYDFLWTGSFKDISLMKQHWPETYMAWLRTGIEPKKANPAKSIVVQCPVDVKVFDPEGVLVANIVNDVVDESDEGRLEAFVDETGAKTVVLPTDAEYTVKLTATDDGEMTYSVREFSEDGEFHRKVTVSDIPIEKGQEFIGTVNGIIDTDADDYSLESNGETITPDKDLSGDELNSIEIKADVKGSGTVLGEGMYTAGDSVVLEAIPKCNSAFEGWYSEDGKKISEDTTLTATAERSAKYTAVFSGGRHSYGGWTVTKPATEISAGEKVRTCSECGVTEKAAVPVLNPTLPAVKISKPAAGTKSATVKWKKLSSAKLKKIKKIEIQCSMDKNFSTGVKTKYASAKKTSYKIKGLKKGKKYFIRIRAYTSSGGKVHVSKWSSKKSVKAK